MKTTKQLTRIVSVVILIICCLESPVLGWGTAEPIGTNAGGAISQQVVVGPNGNAVAVWCEGGLDSYNLWSNRYVAGTGWGTAGLVETETGSAKYPQVAVDGSGNVIAVWEQCEGTLCDILSNRYVVGTGWGTPGLIETDNNGAVGGPDVAVDGSGNAVAVWMQHDGTRSNIWANRYVAGTGWGTPGLIETDNAGYAWDPQVAVDPSGDAVAVWEQHDGTRWNIWSNRYAVGTGWGTAGLIETNNAGSAWYPQVAVDPSGNAVAVWKQDDGTRDNIWANRYAVGTGWGTAVPIETDNAGDAWYPQVAVDGSGNAVAVWKQDDGTRWNIWSNRYVAGTGWGTAVLIETNAGGAWCPQVAVDPSGNAMAVWDQWDGTFRNIYSNRYVAGTGWGTAVLIKTNAEYERYPQVAVGPSGNAVAVWESSGVWANDLTFDRSGSGVATPGETSVISAVDDSISVSVPPGALATATTITVTDSGKGTEFGLSTSGGNGTAYYVVHIEPSGLTFDKKFPVTITLRWPDTNNDGLIDGTKPPMNETDLVIIKDGKVITGKCSQAGSRPGESCNMNLNFFSVQVDSFSDFALWVMTHPAGLVGGWGRDDASQVSGIPDGKFVDFSAGTEHSLAITTKGSIEGWGLNDDGQINVPDGNDFVSVAAGVDHSAALKSDGSIVCWGSNTYGQSNDPNGSDFVAVSAGAYFNLALKSDGTLEGWGRNDDGQINVPDGNDFIAVSAGYYHGLALRTDGTMAAWGDDTDNRATPQDGNDFIAVSAGSFHSLALKSDGSILGWGNNVFGQLDNIPDSNDFTAISGGYEHSLALKSDGSVVAWGSDSYNQVTNTPAANNFIGIAAGGFHNLAMYQCRSTLTADLTGDCYTDLKDLAVFSLQWLDCGNPFDPDCSP